MPYINYHTNNSTISTITSSDYSTIAQNTPPVFTYSPNSYVYTIHNENTISSIDNASITSSVFSYRSRIHEPYRRGKCVTCKHCLNSEYCSAQYRMDNVKFEKCENINSCLSFERKSDNTF